MLYRMNRVGATAFSMKGLFSILSINDIQPVCCVSIFIYYAECHYAQNRQAEYCYAECRGAME
jgi:hypothetical protein